jgi:hypothetical protein
MLVRKRIAVLIGLGLVFLAFFTCFGTLYAIGSNKKLDLEGVSIDNFRMGLSYPPLKNEQQRKFSKNHMEKLNIDLVRTGVSWSYIEANEGHFTWSGFDKRMQFFNENNIDILLTISSDGPEWNVDQKTPESSTYKNITAFEVFLQALFTRYADYNIHKIQFGNEWPNEYQFIGTAEQYVNYSNTVYEIANETIPDTTFVLGGIATANLRIAAAYYNYTDFYRIGTNATILTGAELEGLMASEFVKDGVARVNYVLANASYDELDLHFYDDYENWGTYVTMMNDLVPGVPIIVSEFGGPNLSWEKYTRDSQARHLMESIETLDGIGIEEAYYFKLTQGGAIPQHRKSCLVGSTVTIKPAYYIMQAFTASNAQVNFIFYTEYSFVFMGIISLIYFVFVGIFGLIKVIQKRKLK